MLHNDLLTDAAPSANLMDLMDLQTREAAYAQHEPMLAQLAWKTCYRTGADFDDVREEANWSFMKACERFDPSRGAQFGTLLHITTQFDLLRWSANRARNSVTLPIDDDLVVLAPANDAPSLEYIDQLSEDAQRLVWAILNPPPKLVRHGPTPKQLLRIAKDQLAKEGMEPSRIRAAHMEAREFFRALWS